MKSLSAIFEYIVPIVSFIIPLGQLLFRQHANVLKRVTKFGYTCLVFALIMGLGTCVTRTDKQNDKRDADTAFAQTNRAYNKRFDSLGKDNKLLSSKMDTDRHAYEDSLQRTAYRMSAIFAYGVKHGDKNTFTILTDALSNKKDLARVIDSLTRKLDSCTNGKTDAIITLLPFSNCGFDFKRNRDTVIFDGLIKNAGEGTAYGVTASVYVNFYVAKVLFRTSETSWNIYNHDMVGGLMTKVYTSDFIHIENDSALAFVDFYVIIIKGYFYLDYYKTKKRNISLGFFYYPKEKSFSILSTPFEIDSVLKQSIYIKQK